MKQEAKVLLAVLAMLALAGCTLGARDVDYSPQRGISSDIAASLDHGPTASMPGMIGRQEPIGAVPWENGERHSEAP